MMDQALMEQIVKSMAPDANGEPGAVAFSYQKVRMLLVSDVKHDRMRIIAPVADYAQVTRQQLDAMLVSNFHASLDARYGVREGVLYAAYIHPLSDLSERQIRSGVAQVANLALTFGTDYTSGMLSYGGRTQ